ncbi:MAG: LPXTG cell wall anchor domain-containing protein, partial [Culicoidibacterales bacterium]
VTPEVESTTTTNPEATLPETGMSQAEMVVAIGAVTLMTSAVVLVTKRKKIA